MIQTVGLFFLMLLKIAGWILLVLLAVILAVLLFVLFVPVRYRVFVQNEKALEPGSNLVKKLKVQVKVSWLLHFIHFVLKYGQEGFSNEIHIAGIDVRRVSAWLSRRREARAGSGRRQKKKTEKDTDISSIPDTKTDSSAYGAPEGQAVLPDYKKIDNKELENEEIQNEELENNKWADTDEEKPPDELKTEKKQKKLKKQKNKNSDKNTDTDHNIKQQTAEEKSQSMRKRPHAIKSKFQSMHTKLHAIKSKFQNMHTKLHTIKDKLHKFKQELTSPVNRRVAGHLWKELCYMLCQYKPGKIKADLTFSLADPAITGEVLGLISMLPHVYRYPHNIYADFQSDRLYIEGELMVQGKITGYVMVLILLRLFRDKECMQIVRRLTGRA
ncbi:MAG: hypothetical protein HFH30_14690 [Eubacterium sp.]|nr:hypothetical protein [Eubacterium sp.]